jgi:hypothetical protein
LFSVGLASAYLLHFDGQSYARMFNLVLDFILYPIDEGGLKPTLQTYENQEGGLKHSGVFPTGTYPANTMENTNV